MFMHLFNTYLLGVYIITDTVLVTRNVTMNKTDEMKFLLS